MAFLKLLKVKKMSQIFRRIVFLIFSLRMLINQHTLLFEPDAEPVCKQIGIIDTQCNVSNVIKSAFDSAAFLCEEYYNMAPDLNLQVKYYSREASRIVLLTPDYGYLSAIDHQKYNHI